MFASFQIYVLPNDFVFNLESFERGLESSYITPLTEAQSEKYGFTSVVSGYVKQYVQLGTDVYFRVEKRYKKVPKSSLISVTEQKIEKLKTEQPEVWGQGKKISKSMYDDVKSAVHQQLLKSALTQYKSFNMVFLPDLNVFIIGTTSQKCSEEIISLIRSSIGTFPAIPLIPKSSIHTIFNTWLSFNNLPAPFQLVPGDILLRDTALSKNSVKYSHQAYDSDELSANLQASKVPHQLRLSWADNFEFNINQQLAFTKCKKTDIWNSKMKDAVSVRDDTKEPNADKIESEVTMLILAFKQFIPDLFKSLGGIKRTITETSESNEAAASLINQYTAES